MLANRKQFPLESKTILSFALCGGCILSLFGIGFGIWTTGDSIDGATLNPVQVEVGDLSDIFYIDKTTHSKGYEIFTFCQSGFLSGTTIESSGALTYYCGLKTANARKYSLISGDAISLVSTLSYADATFSFVDSNRMTNSVSVQSGANSLTPSLSISSQVATSSTFSLPVASGLTTDVFFSLTFSFHLASGDSSSTIYTHLSSTTTAFKFGIGSV